MSGHYDETALQEYLEDPVAFPDRQRLEAHVEHCDSCRAVLHELRAFEATLSAGAFWESGEMPAPAEPPHSLRALAAMLSEEDAEAEAILTPLVASPVSFRRANITALPMMRTAGIVRRLCTESRALRERQPMHALDLASAAIEIAERLPPSRYPAPLIDELRGSGWLERANVLRYLGRYPEAVDALDIASRAFSRSPAAAYSGALADYVRAVIYVELDRLDEALRLARKSARVFRQFGEDERYVYAKLVEAGVAFHQERFAEARDRFLALVPAAKALGNAETIARLYANVANCETRLEDFASAETYLSRALSLYEAVGLETGKIRTRWNIGSLRIAAGDADEGLVLLRQARREFEHIGARTDAALVTLEIVETLLASGSTGDTREAAELCSGLAESFSAVGMTGNALTALSFLRQSFETGQATPDLVRHVRQYIETRPDQSGNPFHPPLGT